MPTNRSTVYSTQIIHIGSGTSLAAGVINPSSDVSVALASSNLGRYDRADIALLISNTASVSSASNFLFLYRRDLNFDGTNDEPSPATATSIAWSNHFVAAFQLPPYSVASTTYINLLDIPLTDQCEFYIENKTNTAVGVGWTLKVTPKTDSFA